VKRTAEIVLAVIGVILSGLFAVIGVFFNAIKDDPEFQAMMDEEMSADPALAEADMGALMGIFESVGPFLVIVGIIAGVLGIIGIVAIKGNKKPVLAGVMMILAALVIGLGTIGFGFIPGLLFLIAGIMCFVRKAKPASNEMI
jgi:hypothetical protein